MIKYEDKNYLNTNEAAKFLGKTTTAFRQFMQRRAFPRRKLGGRLYFLQDDLRGFFAKESEHTHFESTGMSFDEVYSLDQLEKILLTTKQNIYYFLRKHNIPRYKDNTNTTLFNKSKIEAVLGNLSHSSVSDL